MLQRTQWRNSSAFERVPARFAVVDVETTGLFVGRHDRVIEIGIISLDEDGNLLESWGTLVNPGRDLGPTDIHGIRGRDVEGAPTFAEIVGDVSQRMAGRVLVAHNARFDSGFLEAEFQRSGHSFPACPWVCTMEIGSRATGARRLHDCCAALDIRHARAHSAVDDARAASEILDRCLDHADTRLELAHLLVQTPIPPAAAWPSAPPCLRTVGRGERPATSTYLAELLDRLPPSDIQMPGAETAYLDVLDRALEDRKLTPQEADGLCELAAQWGLTSSAIERLHNEYLRLLVSAALQDSIITPAERTDLEDVASLLMVEADQLDAMLGQRQDASPPTRPWLSVPEDSLAGKSVCFTGQLTCTIRHLTITREAAQLYAREHGLVVLPNVTKKLDLLVVADPDSLSAKARRARENGTRIIVERAFWRAIEVDID